MPDMIDHLNELAEALEKNIPIECNQKGQWQQEGSCHKITRLLTLNYYDKNQLLTLAKAFTKTLNTLEKTPVVFQNDMKTVQPQYKKFLAYFNAYRTIESKLLFSKDPSIKHELNNIRQRIIGLRYRIEAIHGGLDKTSTPDETIVKYICHLAYDWKSKQTLYPDKSKNISERDIAKIRAACLYPEFIRLLSSNKDLQNQFFTWTIRDNNGAAQFIEFPATCERLQTCILSKRIGLLAPEELNIVEEKISSGYQKVICLPFFDGHDINRINILDESKKVTLNNDRSISIKEILAIFAYKRITAGNVEFFGTKGIMNWSNFELGALNTKAYTYNRINLTDPEWWRQLPVLKEFSKEEMEARYQLSLKPGDWVRCINSTRENLDYTFNRRHGYIEMAIPLDNGHYAIYPFGKFPKHYPTSIIGQIRLIVQTLEARIEYPDQNTFYSHRQRAIQSKMITPDQGKAFMEHIRTDLIKSVNNNLPFQLGYENCAHWAEELLLIEEGKNAPNAFKMPLTQMHHTHKPMELIFRAPAAIQSAIMNGFKFFAYIDGKKFKEKGELVYKNTPFNAKINEVYQYQPAHLNDQIENGSLHGVISYGN